MTWWLDYIDGKPYLIMRFEPEAMEVLKKYHKTISRMTNIDFSRIAA